MSTRIHPDNTRHLLCLALFAIASGLPVYAQQGLSTLVHGNEVFARKLLRESHQPTPNENIVVAPIPLTVEFAALQSDLRDDKAQAELGEVFSWGTYPWLNRPSHMLLAAFAKSPWSSSETGSHPAHDQITSTVFYRTPTASQLFEPSFLQRAQQFFGMTFERASSPLPLSPNGKRPGILIDSRMHLQLEWRTNLFLLSDPRPGSFHNISGTSTTVTMLDSELSMYPHVKNEYYEAVELPCDGGSMIVIIPALGKTIADIEQELSGSVETLDHSLAKGPGFVSIPAFHIQVRENLRPSLERLGIHSVFQNLEGVVKVLPSNIEQMSQEVDFEVDRNGIRADAETFTAVMAGGIMSVPKPFEMVTDRPFIFIVRDAATGATTFLGAVVELPNAKPQAKQSR